MITKSLLELSKRAFSIRKYPTADRNAHFMKLLWQSIPYFVSWSGYSLPPLSVFIHVNSRCNLKCKMCDAGQADENSMFYKNLSGAENGVMSISDFKTIIDKVKQFKPFVGIPAMEPLMYPHITEAIQYVKNQGLRCSVATNGTFLESFAERIVKSGLTKIVISLDGPQAIHDKIRGVPGTFNKAVLGIRKLAEMKKRIGSSEPFVYLNYVIQEDNYSSIENFIKGIPLEDIAQVDFRVMFYCTESLAKKHNNIYGKKYDATTACLAGGINLDNVDTDILYDQMQKVTRQYDKCKFFFNHGKNGLYKHYHEPEVFLDATRCVMHWYTMQVNTDGNVIPPQRCYHQLFGNIVKDDFAKIWNGPHLRDFRKDLRKAGRFPACTRCEGVNF